MLLPKQIDTGTQTVINTILSAPVEVLLAAALFAFGIGGLVLAFAALRQVSSNTERLEEDSKQTRIIADLVVEIREIARTGRDASTTAQHTDTTVTAVQADVKELASFQRLALQGLKKVYLKVNAIEQKQGEDRAELHTTLEDIKVTIHEIALSIQKPKDR